MIGLIQGVTRASVEIDLQEVASIDFGLLLMIGFFRGDERTQIERFVDRVISYRIFRDKNGKTNRSLIDAKGQLLIIPQFTLAAETSKGNRPSFSSALEPQTAKLFFQEFVERAQTKLSVEAGVFGAHMEIHSVNDGPCSFILTG